MLSTLCHVLAIFAATSIATVPPSGLAMQSGENADYYLLPRTGSSVLSLCAAKKGKKPPFELNAAAYYNESITCVDLETSTESPNPEIKPIINVAPAADGGSYIPLEWKLLRNIGTLDIPREGGREEVPLIQYRAVKSPIRIGTQQPASVLDAAWNMIAQRVNPNTGLEMTANAPIEGGNLRYGYIFTAYSAEVAGLDSDYEPLTDLHPIQLDGYKLLARDALPTKGNRVAVLKLDRGQVLPTDYQSNFGAVGNIEHGRHVWLVAPDEAARKVSKVLVVDPFGHDLDARKAQDASMHIFRFKSPKDARNAAVNADAAQGMGEKIFVKYDEEAKGFRLATPEEITAWESL